MIEEYDAGWLVDPTDVDAVEETFEEIISDRGALLRKTKNARTLAAAVIDPAVAVEPLVRIVEGW